MLSSKHSVSGLSNLIAECHPLLPVDIQAWNGEGAKNLKRPWDSRWEAAAEPHQVLALHLRSRFLNLSRYGVRVLNYI